MAAPRSSANATGSRADVLASWVYYLALGLTAWFILVAGIAYLGGGYESVVVAVAAFFALVSLGLPVLLLRMERSARLPETRARRVPDMETGAMETASGRLDVRSARIQVLLVPAALSVGFTLLGLEAVLLS